MSPSQVSDGPKCLSCNMGMCQLYWLWSFQLSTEGPPLTRFSLPRIPLPQFLAYVRASGGFFALVFNNENFYLNYILQGVPHLRNFHYRRSHYRNFWLMYVQVGDFYISSSPTNVNFAKRVFSSPKIRVRQGPSVSYFCMTVCYKDGKIKIFVEGCIFLLR